MLELDPNVAAVWRAMLDPCVAEELVGMVVAFEMTRENVLRALEAAPVSLAGRAFQALLRNRVFFGGIMAPGARPLKRGEKDQGIGSKWKPGELRSRILNICHMRDRITFLEGDGVRFLVEHQGDDAAWFVDPPYLGAGGRLYTHSTVDPEAILRTAAGLRGDFLITYDPAPAVQGLARQYGLDTHTILMQNRRGKAKRELLIGRDLGWAR
jgi:DNA adenine methylase